EHRDKAIALGTDLIDKALRKHDTTMQRADKQLKHAAEELGCQTVDELIVQIGYGKITVAQVLEKALPQLGKKGDGEAAPKAESMLKTLLRKMTRRTSSSGIKVAGEEDILVRFAKCCSPLPGDPIVGFITRGRGVTVHR